jgi:hypothetical protein
MSARKPDPDASAWAEVQTYLSHPYGQAAFLTADGHVIQARVMQSKMRLNILCYVDGQYRGEWLKTAKTEAELPELPRRACRTVSLWAYKAKDRTPAARKMIKRLGLGWDLDAKLWQTGLTWGTAAACIRHLRKANPGIRILEWDEAVQMVKVMEAERAAGGAA